MVPNQAPALHWPPRTIDASAPSSFVFETNPAGVSSVSDLFTSDHDVPFPDGSGFLFPKTLHSASTEKILEPLTQLHPTGQRMPNEVPLRSASADGGVFPGNELFIAATDGRELPSVPGRRRLESEVDELAQLIKLSNEEHRSVQQLLQAEPFMGSTCALAEADDTTADDHAGFLIKNHGSDSTSDLSALLLTPARGTRAPTMASPGTPSPQSPRKSHALASPAAKEQVTASPQAFAPSQGYLGTSAAARVRSNQRPDASRTSAARSVEGQHRVEPQNESTAKARPRKSQTETRFVHPEVHLPNSGLTTPPESPGASPSQVPGVRAASGKNALPLPAESVPSKRSESPSSEQKSPSPKSDGAGTNGEAASVDEYTLRKRETHNLHTRVSRKKVSQCFERLVTVLTADCAVEESEFIICNELDGACIPEQSMICACCGLDGCMRQDCRQCKAPTNTSTTNTNNQHAAPASGVDTPPSVAAGDVSADNADPKALLTAPGTCCGWRDRFMPRRERARALRARLRHRAETLQYATQTIVLLRRQRRSLELLLLHESESFRRLWVQHLVEQVQGGQQKPQDEQVVITECCKSVVRAVLEQFHWPFGELWMLGLPPPSTDTDNDNEKEACAEQPCVREGTASASQRRQCSWDTLQHQATLIVPPPAEETGYLDPYWMLALRPDKAQATDPPLPDLLERPSAVSEARLGTERDPAAPPVRGDCPADSPSTLLSSSGVSSCNAADDPQPMATSSTRCAGGCSESLTKREPNPELDQSAALLTDLECFATESKQVLAHPSTTDIQNLVLRDQRAIGARLRAGAFVEFDPRSGSERTSIAFERAPLARRHNLRCLVAIPLLAPVHSAPDKRPRLSSASESSTSIRGVAVLGHVEADAAVQPLLQTLESLWQHLMATLARD